MVARPGVSGQGVNGPGIISEVNGCSARYNFGGSMVASPGVGRKWVRDKKGHRQETLDFGEGVLSGRNMVSARIDRLGVTFTNMY